MGSILGFRALNVVLSNGFGCKGISRFRFLCWVYRALGFHVVPQKGLSLRICGVSFRMIGLRVFRFQGFGFR